MNQILNRIFHIQERQSSIMQEFMGALTIYLTAMYVFLLIPTILHPVTDIPFTILFTATCVIVAICTLLMAFVANMPLFVAPTIAYISYISYVIIPHYGLFYTLLVIASIGILFIIAVITPLHTWINNGIPNTIRHGYITGLGIFMFFIGIQNIGIVVSNPITFSSVGNLLDTKVLLGIFVTLMIFTLYYYKSKFFILLPIVIGFILVLIFKLEVLSFHMPTDNIEPLYFWRHHGTIPPFKYSLITVIIALSITVFIDADSTFRIMTNNTFTPKLYRKIFGTLGVGMILASLFGIATSTVIYIETKSGIDARAKTGLTNVFLSIFALSTLFLLPIAKFVPTYIVSAALIYIGFSVIMTHIRKIELDHVTKWVPGFLTMLMLPFTSSIAVALTFGFFSYVFLNIMTKNWHDISLVTYILTLILTIGIFL